MTLLLLVACSSTDPVVVGTLAPRPDTGSPYVTPEDVGGREPDVESDEDVGDQATTELDADVFDDTRIHEIDIEVKSDALAALDASPYDWVPVAVTYDGVTVETVGLRLRGKIGSFRTMSGKPKFKIGFNEYVDDQRFYGLKELSLNNSVVDCSYMKEPMSWQVFRAAGVPWLRTAFARVRVNGSDYGLYQVVEAPNDDWVERFWQDGSGNLYDGKYVWYGGWSYTLLDFGTGVDDLFQLEEGTDVGNADIKAVSDAVLSVDGGFFDRLDPLLDWETFHAMVAAEVFVGHLDGYSMNTNNYRVYFDPSDGKATVVPWDMDYTFLEDYQWGMDWHRPRGQLTYWCYLDDACHAQQVEANERFLAALDEGLVLEEFDRLATLTLEDAMTDPRAECNASDVAGWRDYVRGWIAGRAAMMEAEQW